MVVKTYHSLGLTKFLNSTYSLTVIGKLLVLEHSKRLE